MLLTEEWWEKLDNNDYVGAVLMDFSKVFDCIFYDLVIPKFMAYSLSYGALKLILFYLSHRQQCVRKQYSQDSILGAILCDLSIYFSLLKNLSPITLPMTNPYQLEHKMFLI